MPSRMDLKTNRSKKRTWIVAACVIAVLIVAIAVIWLLHGSNSGTQSDKFGSAVSSSKVSSKSNKKSLSSSESSSTSSSAPKSPVGLGFSITPIKYNGEDVDDAMNAQRAPQNTVHDNALFGYFKSDSVARLTGIPAYFYVHSVPYAIEGNEIRMDNKTIPYRIQNGSLQTVQFNETDRDGNTITYEFKPLTDAKQTVESHAQPAGSDSESDTSSSSGSVDQKNLTTAQMEHWVRSFIKSVSQVYVPKEYTCTQRFVDGYAEVYAYFRKNGVGKRDLAAIYRVNGDGYLEIRDGNASGQWRVVSKKFF